MMPTVDYLGYRIDRHGLRPLPDKLAAITEAPEPQNVPELRAFLGLDGKFINQLSSITHPLNRLLCKGNPWVWGKKCREVFTMLKSKLASTEVLAHYNLSS